MSLYANLLNPTASISGAPVLYDNGEKDDAASKKDVASGMHNQLHLQARAFFLLLWGPQLTTMPPSVQPCASSPSADLR